MYADSVYPIAPEDLFPDRAEELLDEIGRYHNELKSAESYYYTIERKKVMEQVRSLVEENKEFAKECAERRKQETKELIESGKRKLERLMQERGNIDEKKSVIDAIKKMERSLKSKITPFEIERAKESPISQMIFVNKRGMARCVNHDDRNPSMWCKDNYAYCFSCGWHGSAIDVYMKVNSKSFSHAVKDLSV